MKKTYEAPAIVELGSVIELTLGQATGTKSDAAFPAGTPVSSFTFS